MASFCRISILMLVVNSVFGGDVGQVNSVLPLSELVFTIEIAATSEAISTTDDYQDSKTGWSHLGIDFPQKEKVKIWHVSRSCLTTPAGMVPACLPMGYFSTASDKILNDIKLPKMFHFPKILPDAFIRELRENNEIIRESKAGIPLKFILNISVSEELLPDEDIDGKVYLPKKVREAQNQVLNQSCIPKIDKKEEQLLGTDTQQQIAGLKQAENQTPFPKLQDEEFGNKENINDKEEVKKVDLVAKQLKKTDGADNYRTILTFMMPICFFGIIVAAKKIFFCYS